MPVYIQRCDKGPLIATNIADDWFISPCFLQNTSTTIVQFSVTGSSYFRFSRCAYCWYLIYMYPCFLQNTSSTIVAIYHPVWPREMWSCSLQNPMLDWLKCFLRKNAWLEEIRMARLREKSSTGELKIGWYFLAGLLNFKKKVFRFIYTKILIVDL